MGLCFHYKGALKKPQLLEKIIEEVTDIAKTNQWAYHVFKERFLNDVFTSNPNDDEQYGICFSPAHCEVVALTFRSKENCFK